MYPPFAIGVYVIVAPFQAGRNSRLLALRFCNPLWSEAPQNASTVLALGSQSKPVYTLRMNTSRIAQLLNVNPETVRRWAAEYTAFLSPTATPEKGRTREFKDFDVRVLAHIAHLRETGFNHAEVTERLEGLRAGEWGDLPAVPPEWFDERQLEAHELKQLGEQLATIASLQVELKHVTQALESAQGQVQALEARLAESDAKQTTTETERQALQIELERAKGEVSTLQARLEAYRLSYSFGRSQPVNVGVLLVVAVLAGALLVTLVFIVARLVM